MLFLNWLTQLHNNHGMGDGELQYDRYEFLKQN